MKNRSLTYISLFSCGGVGCFAFKQAGFDCIATNEINEKRLQIQKYNKKCIREEGYINGDICLQKTKDRIYSEISWWKNTCHIKDVDVIIATPPCQGMSVANHKKKQNEIERNSLILESIEMIQKIEPIFFIFENVPSFLKTICISEQNINIWNAINTSLETKYCIKSEIINFKNYGANSSRNRTIVIGVRKDYAKFVNPIELFPFRTEERTLKEIIGHLKPLTKMNEIDANDIYHAFRAYPEYMRNWIHDLKEGESAFDNQEINKRPYKMINNNMISIKNKNRDKYTRLYWDKVAPGIHTRNDQLASQNTIHPHDDRVLSIRELMEVMSIPKSFKWSEIDEEELNALSEDKKNVFLKKNEMLIRQCIGEAVPTSVFSRIAEKMKEILLLPPKTDKELEKLIEVHNLSEFTNLSKFINNNKLGEFIKSRLIELANNKREENAAYYTGRQLLDSVYDILPVIDKNEIRILEPSVGAGNFLPFIIARYSYAKSITIDVIDIDTNVITLLKNRYQQSILPDNVKINFYSCDFLIFNHDKDYDLILGNPPFKKLKKGQQLNFYRNQSLLNNSHNLVSFFLEKATNIAENVLFIVPKSLINLKEYKDIRDYLYNFSITAIVDFGDKAFVGVNIETICLLINTKKKPFKTRVISKNLKIDICQKQKYIMSTNLPNWVIYRDEYFDKIISNKALGVFSTYRDRQLSKKNTFCEGEVWIIQARNLALGCSKLQHLPGYDRYINLDTKFKISSEKYLNTEKVFIVPNMTYYPRIIEKPKKTLVNGSVVILIPKKGIEIKNSDIDFICSKNFEDFYRIAINFATRTINVDEGIAYYYCID